MTYAVCYLNTLNTYLPCKILHLEKIPDRRAFLEKEHNCFLVNIKKVYCLVIFQISWNLRLYYGLGSCAILAVAVKVIFKTHVFIIGYDKRTFSYYAFKVNIKNIILYFNRIL